MKKNRMCKVLIGLAVIIGVVTGCAEKETDITSNVESTVEIAKKEEVKTEETTTYKTVEYDGIKVEVNEKWEEVEFENGKTGFTSENQEQVYTINGVSELGGMDTNEIYKEIVSIFEENAKVTGKWEELKDVIGSDNTKMKIGFVQMEYGENANKSLMYILLIPDKNLMITLNGQYGIEENASEVEEELARVAETITFTIGAEDVVSGKRFIAGDGSEVCLESDGTFRWYRNPDNHEDEYYEGTYSVSRSEEAITTIDSMTQYGVTKDVLEEMIKANMAGYVPHDLQLITMLDSFSEEETEVDEETVYRICKDNYYAIILSNDRLVQGEVTEYEEPMETLLTGYYIEELNLLDLINYNTADNAVWNLQEN